MAAARTLIQAEPNGWDKKVSCSFKNLHSINTRKIIYKNLTYYFKHSNFESILQQTISDEYSFECTRDEANSIRDNLHLILTSTHSNVWFTINTYPLHKLHEFYLSDKKLIRHQPSKILFSFGSMYSTDLFYNHTKQFPYTGTIKVWNERNRATALIISIPSIETKIKIPIEYIQKSILVNIGHDNQPIQIIFMLKYAVKVEEKETRIGNDNDPKSFINILSKSSDLLIQFDPPANAWPFLLSLPIIGHTENNKRQDGNLEINFASFKYEDWPIDNQYVRPKFSSFDSQYSMEMLESLGYVFTDKYAKSTKTQNFFKTLEHDCQNNFYNFCSSLYKALINTHCLNLDDFINQDKQDIHLSNKNNQFLFVRQLTLTPMRMIFKPFEPERGNRALHRRSVEKYIRVHIREENDELFDHLDEQIRLRFRSKMLTNGIVCMNKTYYCIGASTSQMKNFSYWFTTLDNGETIDQVRAQFGNFTEIKNQATYVARIGLYFTTSTKTDIHLNYFEPKSNNTSTLLTQIRSSFYQSSNKPAFEQDYVVHVIADVKNSNGDYCFTDGCGLISFKLAQQVAEQIGLEIKQPNDVPSVFQVRIAGCKGILMIDPESVSNDRHYIKIRPSMIKFPSNDWTLYICNYSYPILLSLNNQIIRLLTDLGNKFDVFESLQNRAAKPALWHAPEDAYLNLFESQLIDYQQARYINGKEILLKNKIPLAKNEARNMFGVADVTGTLKYGQCFIQYSIETEKGKIYKIVKGTVLVTKNPCLYPGDIRKLEAIDVPMLRNCMRDCIVFPINGHRPHHDEISGSDLDGDQYWVYWGNDLKVEKLVDPLSHTAAEKLTVPKITNESVIDYYLDQFNHNSYALIADIHTVVADRLERNTLSPECIELATLFYRAIDSPKTGEIIDMTRVEIFRKEFCQSYPRFMMKSDKSYYESSSILEKLYLNAKNIFLSNKINHITYHATPTTDYKIVQSTETTVTEEADNQQLFNMFKKVLQYYKFI